MQLQVEIDVYFSVWTLIYLQTLWVGCTEKHEPDEMLQMEHFICVFTVCHHIKHIQQLKWAVTCDFQQCGILTCVDSDEPVQPPFRRRNSKWCSVSSLTVIENTRDKQRLWSDCAYAQADLRLCWPHIPHCWKSYALAQMILKFHPNKQWFLHLDIIIQHNQTIMFRA